MASAVNLRGGDVPGMGTLVAGFETNNGPPFGRCATHVDVSNEVLGLESPWFVRSRGQRRLRAGVIVGRPPVAGGHSIIYVMSNSEIARDNVAAVRRASATDCVKRSSVSEASGRLVGGEPYKVQDRGFIATVPAFGRCRLLVARTQHGCGRCIPREEEAALLRRHLRLCSWASRDRAARRWCGEAVPIGRRAPPAFPALRPREDTRAFVACSPLAAGQRPRPMSRSGASRVGVRMSWPT